MIPTVLPNMTVDEKITALDLIDHSSYSLLNDLCRSSPNMFSNYLSASSDKDGRSPPSLSGPPGIAIPRESPGDYLQDTPQAAYVTTFPTAQHCLIAQLGAHESWTMASTIPSIIATALNEANDAGGARKMAFQLLACLSRDVIHDDKTDQSSAHASLQDPEHSGRHELLKYTFHATRFMTSLAQERLRASVVELLSFLSTDITSECLDSLDDNSILTS